MSVPKIYVTRSEAIFINQEEQVLFIQIILVNTPSSHKSLLLFCLAPQREGSLVLQLWCPGFQGEMGIS